MVDKEGAADELTVGRRKGWGEEAVMLEICNSRIDRERQSVWSHRVIRRVGQCYRVI